MAKTFDERFPQTGGAPEPARVLRPRGGWPRQRDPSPAPALRAGAPRLLRATGYRRASPSRRGDEGRRQCSTVLPRERCV